MMFLLLLGCTAAPSTTAAKIDSAAVDTADSEGDSGGSDSPPPTAGSCDDASYNPWLGTCVDVFFEPCFVPSGLCNVVPGEASSLTTWENDATVLLEQGAGMPPPLTITVRAPDGTVCATGQTVETPDCSVADERMGVEFTRTQDGAVESWCVALDGSLVEATCPDGSTESVSPGTPGAMACMFGGDRSCDPFGAPPPRWGRGRRPSTRACRLGAAGSHHTWTGLRGRRTGPCDEPHAMRAGTTSAGCTRSPAGGGAPSDAARAGRRMASATTRGPPPRRASSRN